MLAQDFVEVDDPVVREQLARDGVVLIDGLLTPEEVDETREELVRYERDVLPGTPKVHREYYADGAVRCMTELQRYDSWFHEFAHRDRFWRLIRGAVDWEPKLYYLETFPKPPGGRALRMHQEYFTAPVDPPQFLHLWIALDDSTRERAGLVFYQGTHRLGLAPHVFHADGVASVESELLERLSDRRLEPDIPAGSAALFDAGVIHGSNANTTGEPRLSMIVAVRGAGTTLPGDTEIFASTVTRFFRDEIGVDKCAADDDFTALGGDEAAAGRVVERIADFFGVELTLEQFADHRTPNAVARQLIARTGWHDPNT